MKRITIVLDDDVQRRVESLAKLEGRSETEVVPDALRVGLMVRRRDEEIARMFGEDDSCGRLPHKSGETTSFRGLSPD